MSGRGAERDCRRSLPARPVSRASVPAALAAAFLASTLLAAGLAGSCAEPWPAPRGAAELLSAWEELGVDLPASVAVAWRVSCAGGASDPAVERFGITLRADSELRGYWLSITMELRLPPGASTTGSARIPFSSLAERYQPGSARIESAWFE